MASKNPIVFRAEAEGSNGNSYVVSQRADGSWSCSCPGWKFHTPRKACKHITAVKEHEQNRIDAGRYGYQYDSLIVLYQHVRYAL